MNDYLVILESFTKHFLAWPFLFFILVLIFKKHLFSLLGNIKQLDFGSTKIKFKEMIDSSREQIKCLEEKLGKDKITTEDNKDKIKSDNCYSSLQKIVAPVANISPVAAIPYVFLHLENEIIRELPAIYNYKKEKEYVQEVFKNLFKLNMISDDVYNSFNSLRKVNDFVLSQGIGPKKISKKYVMKYVKCVGILIDIINEYREP